MFVFAFSTEAPAFEVLPSLKRLKQRIIAASRGQYDAVFMSGRYGNWKLSLIFYPSMQVQ